MTTRETIEAYFNSLEKRSGWESLLSDQIRFTSFTAPVREISGKPRYLEATKRFYSTFAAVEVRELIGDGRRACAATRYRIQPAGGAAFLSDVAELFTVRDEKIETFSIYFDPTPYPK